MSFRTLTDSYKASHYKQYPPGTTKVYSFLQSRVGARWDETVWVGLQYFLRAYLSEAAVAASAPEFVRDFELLNAHLGPGIANIDGWHHLYAKHGHRLPLRIKAVAEGTVVPTDNVLMTVENTDPDFYWLTNYVESLLVQTWYPSTVATQSRIMKRVLAQYLDETGTPGDIEFKLHDFGLRGSTSPESAALGGFAHLVNFKGTDTMPALQIARDHYGCNMAGFSIPAAEHSTITSWGKEHECDAYANMLDQYPTGLVAVVSDSYDIFHACQQHWGTTLRERVLSRDGTLVIRPDSGEPVSVLRRVLAILKDRFGATLNDKGYWVLNPKVRVIQGDGIDLASMTEILRDLKATRVDGHGWSADNLAFGSGGGLLQKDLTRDTQRIAFKASYVEGDGWRRDVMKSPITDPYKISKAGRFALTRDEHGYHTCSEGQIGERDNLLRTVFENGVLFNEERLDDIRARAAL